MVSGVELYYASNAVEYRGVAVVAGTPDPLTGAAGFRACRDHGVTNPTQLAGLALHFFGGGGKIVVDGATANQEKPEVQKLVHAPAIDKGVLEFWGLDKRGELLIRYRLDMAALRLDSQAGQALVTSQRNPIDVAVEHLAGPSSLMYQEAIDALVSACKDPRAAKALNDVTAKHKNNEARRWAAFQSASIRDRIAADQA